MGASAGSINVTLTLDSTEYLAGLVENQNRTAAAGAQISAALSAGAFGAKDLAEAMKTVSAAGTGAADVVSLLGAAEAESAARIKEMVANSLAAQAAMADLSAQSQNAASGVNAMGASADQVRASVAAQTQSMIDAQRATSAMNDEMQALKSSLAQGSASFATIGDQYERLDRAMATGKLTMEEYDAALAAIGKDEDARTKSLAALTAKYDPLGAATRKLAADQAVLEDAFKSGAISADDYERTLNGIKADQASVSLRQLAQQEKELEAAFRSGTLASTDYKKAMADIATSRAALGSVETGAKSAGSALEDFGLKTAGARKEVVVLAHEALTGSWSNFGGSIMVLAERMDLMEVATSGAALAVAAIAAPLIAFGAAVYKVSGQNAAMNEALVMTGNYAGVTSDELRGMAQAATAGGATFDTAAEAVTALAATGRLTGEEIADLGRTTADAATYTSVSVKQMVDDFTKLAEDPVKASVALNDQYHYLTASTYDQIVALEKQGDATGAAQIAVDAFSKAMDDRTGEIAKNEGVILAGWRDIKSMINGAIEAVGSFGATAGPAEVVARMLANKQARLPIDQWDADDEADLQNAIAARDAALKAAREKASNDEKQQQLIDSKQWYATWNDQFATPAEKRVKAVNEYLDKTAALNLSPEQQLADEQKINDKDKDKTGRKGGTGLVDRAELAGEVQAVKDALAEELAAVSSAQKQLDALYKSGGISESAYYQQTRDLIAQKYTDEIDAYNKEAALLAQGLNDRKLSASQRAQINNQIQSDQAKAAKATEDFFSTVAESAAKEDEVWQKYGQSQIDALVKQATTLAQQDQGLKDQIATYGMTKSAIDNLTAARTQHELAMEQEGLAQARLNNLAPETIKQYEQTVTALQNVLAQQQSIAADQSTLDALKNWQNTIDQIGTDFHNGFLQMLTDGKAGWASFTKSLINTFETTVADALYKEFLKPIVVNVVANIAGLTGASSVASSLLGQNGSASGSGALGYANNAMSAYSAYSNLSGYAASAIGSVSGGLSSGTAATLANGMGGDTLGNFIALKGLSSGASTAGSAGATSGVFSAGSAVPIAGWVLAAMAANDMLFSKGWDIKNGLDYSGLIKADLGSSLLSGGLIAPGTLTIGSTGAKLLDQGLTGLGLSDHIASLLSGTSIISALFGHKTPEVTNAGVAGTVSLSDVSGVDFADWVSKGGLFSHDKHGTQTSAMTDDQKTAITSAVQGAFSTYSNLESLAGGPSIDAAAQGFSYNFRDDWRSDDKIQASLNGMTDALANVALPDLKQFQQQGETLVQTATRLTTVFQSTNDLASILGKSLDQAFGSLGLSSTTVRQNLVDAAGGLDNFNSEVAAYYSTYYSSAEQLARSQQTMQDSFASLNLTMPKSEAEFRALVSSLDLTTASGQSTFAALMQLAPSFAQLSDTVNQQLDTLRQNVSTAYDTESSALSNYRDQLSSLISSLTTGDLSTASPETLYDTTKATYQDLLAKADAGDSTAQAGLAQAAQDFLTASKSYNASSAQYQSDLASVLSSIDVAKSNADQQLDLMKQQVAGILDVDASVQTLAQALAAYKSAPGVDGSHASGLYRVPFDGYIAELHQGERVLTANEARVLDASGGGMRTLDLSRYQSGGNDVLLQEIKALRGEVAKLRTDRRQADVMHATQRADLAKDQREVTAEQTTLLRDKRRPGKSNGNSN